MKVEIVNRPIYHFILTSEEKKVFKTVANILNDLYSYDKEDQLWNEFLTAFPTKEDGIIEVDNFDVMGAILRDVLDLAEVKD